MLRDKAGEFLSANLPAGASRLRVSCTGMAPELVAISAVERIEVGRRDFGQTAPAAGSVVKRDAFKVSTSREMSAADMAINEKRIAANIRKGIVTDAFGTLAQDNLGDFL